MVLRRPDPRSFDAVVRRADLAYRVSVLGGVAAILVSTAAVVIACVKLFA